MGVTNASNHLQVLRHARLVETRKDGTRVLYRLAGDAAGGPSRCRRTMI
jgi:DNA-binding transcriptional ArsR family regulator